ncbi:DUF1853 family protein [Gaetbulibacter saemankumensis]|uniref:DUF1853 family protein n=1 Tax=Gaetbulibacter saemankumensis TaxID=311208 RepID=UPI001FDFCDCE|nr:DUF1853 family protein [Gaetbulibacter saemankumensis]
MLIHSTQEQYIGYLNTPLLWETNSIFNIKQFKLKEIPASLFNDTILSNLRLGKRVERFVSYELKQHDSIDILLENIQIQDNKITKGEIDCILKYQDQPIHLEIVFKFYLYDHKISENEIECWIGPNRKDSLLNKLTKLRDKQLPLLHNHLTNKILEKLHLKASDINQRVLFKAQLFIPYFKRSVKFNVLNKACLTGYYIHFKQLSQFSNCKGYIPNKINWLCEVKPNVNWLHTSTFEKEIATYIRNETAPLTWIKHPNGVIEKVFVVWWD